MLFLKGKQVLGIKTNEAIQEDLLPGVSRTFALTIPQLPNPLKTVVTNAYLLCRIADTIEDDDQLSALDKQKFHTDFIEVVMDKASIPIFTENLSKAISPRTSPAEKNLISHIPAVITCLQNFTPSQQKILQKCVHTMAEGMPLFQRKANLSGLGNLNELNRYCYFVAGVVGEMLTELFCNYSKQINRKYDYLMKLAPSFGQGLQMTNILKDIWEDQKRGVCWLPQDIFQQYDFHLINIAQQQESSLGFNNGIKKLLGIALGHLYNALQYTLLIPRQETGIRRFCLWAIGLAVLTLRRINQHLDFKSGTEVKVSRPTLRKTIFTINLTTMSNSLLKWLFYIATNQLPRPPKDIATFTARTHEYQYE